jgi:hypothetical protein
MPYSFTPGPWRVHPYRDGTIGPFRLNKAIDVGPYGLAVATVIGAFEQPTAGPEAEANARLIAAAPTMLAALEAADRALSTTLAARGYRDGSSVDDWSPEVRGEVQARVAVRAGILAAAGPLPPLEGIGTPVEAIGTTPTRGNSDV